MIKNIRPLDHNNINDIIHTLISINEYDNLLQIHSSSTQQFKDNLVDLLQDASSHFYSIQLNSGSEGIVGISQNSTVYTKENLDDNYVLYVWFDELSLLTVWDYLDNFIKEKIFSHIGKESRSIHSYGLNEGHVIEEFLLLLGAVHSMTYKNLYIHYMIATDKTHSIFDIRLSHFSVIHHVELINNNQIYIKRDDLLPLSFGGNKARKALYFFKDILKGHYDTVVTYGSHQSNHCRVVANLCAKYQLDCIIISPQNDQALNLNQSLLNLTQAITIQSQLSQVQATIDRTLDELKSQGHTPYFISGGGHGNLGTHAYVLAYSEIIAWQYEHGIEFDYIFLASGTGTTQAGLVIGNQLQPTPRARIIGMSVARQQEYGRSVIYQSIQDYLHGHSIYLSNLSEEAVEFYDQYTLTTYGHSNEAIHKTARRLYIDHSIPTSNTYTAKAYQAMENYIHTHQLTNKKILFLHTGGLPLFFDDLFALHPQSNYLKEVVL